jgi:hypothetical protein
MVGRGLVPIAASLLLVGISLAQKAIDVSETGKPSFEGDFPSGGELRMQIRSAGLKIVGSNDNKVRVNYTGKNVADTGKVKVSFTMKGSVGELRIGGGSRNDFQIEVHVPANTNLYLRNPAGDLEISGVNGDKDISLHAGDIHINTGSPQEYADVDLSSRVGDINAGPFAASKSGFFRHFHQQGSGKYHLHVPMGAGDITLN